MAANKHISCKSYVLWGPCLLSEERGHLGHVSILHGDTETKTRVSLSDQWDTEVSFKNYLFIVYFHIIHCVPTTWHSSSVWRKCCGCFNFHLQSLQKICGKPNTISSLFLCLNVVSVHILVNCVMPSCSRVFGCISTCFCARRTLVPSSDSIPPVLVNI